MHSGFTAEFTPREVGPHSISVEYNGHPVSGTPFVAKAYDAKKVYVGPLPQGHVGKPLQFTGNLFCWCKTYFQFKLSLALFDMIVMSVMYTFSLLISS